MRISDWSSDVCSSDLFDRHVADQRLVDRVAKAKAADRKLDHFAIHICTIAHRNELVSTRPHGSPRFALLRSEEHTSELQSLMRISYAVFCLKKTQKY